MTNKTSDKNVANIEEDVKNVRQYINLVLDKGYCDCNELNVISAGRYCDGSKNVAYSMQNLLEEREQDKKRIQELERKNKHLSNTSDYETISLECTHLEEQLDIANSRIQELEKEKNKTQIISPYHVKENYIMKQAVIDRIKDLKLSGGSNGTDNVENLVRELVIDVLQELLETK